MTDLISKQYASSLEEDAHWLTEYAQGKKDCQRLIEITTTMYRAAWALGKMPSAQPERLELSEEDMRLFKKLRSFHAGSYAKLLDRIMAKASAQPEIIRCKDCKHRPDEVWFGCPMASSSKWNLDGFCSFAERRTDDER